MVSVGSYEAKTCLSKLLERVQKGEKITITKHGHPVALLISPPEQKKSNVKDVIEELKTTSKGRSLGDISIREMIEEGRRF